MRHSAGLALAAILVAATSCTEPPRPAATTVTEEDGVRVVSNTGSTGAVSGWRLREVYHTGWEDDEPTFEYVITAKIRSDGSVLVSDYNGNQVWLLGPDGEVLDRIGRSGEGPGEYIWPDAAIPGRGDTIYVQSSGGRFSTFVGTEAVDARQVLWGFRQGQFGMELNRQLPGGDFLFTHSGVSPRGTGQWQSGPVLRMRPDMQTGDTLGYYEAVFDQPREDRNPLRQWGSVWASGDSGYVTARNETPEVTWFDLDGQATQIARWDHQPREMTEEKIDEYVRLNLARGSRELSEEALARGVGDERAAIDGPLPIWRRLLSDPSGNVWLTTYGDHPLDFGGEAYVISADGQWLGSVAVPDGVMLMDVTERWAVGIKRNEWDIQAVYLLEIVRPEG